MKKERNTEKKSVYEIMQTQLLDRIEAAIQSDQPFHWVKPWQGAPYPCSYSRPEKPFSAAVNFLFLDAGEYLTFSQVRKLQEADPQIRIRKGSKQVYVYQSFPIFETDKEGNTVYKENGEPAIEGFRIRYTREYHISDIENLKSHFIKKEYEHEKTEQTALADELIHSYAQKYGVSVEERYGISEAYAQGMRVVLPDKTQYESVYEYYATAFHELAHNTKRTGENPREGISYAQEELVAEITASFLCASLHLQDDRSLQNNLAYLKGWYGKIKDAKPTEVYFAAQSAKQAADQILRSAPQICQQIQGGFEISTGSKEISKKEIRQVKAR